MVGLDRVGPSRPHPDAYGEVIEVEGLFQQRVGSVVFAQQLALFVIDELLDGGAGGLAHALAERIHEVGGRAPLSTLVMRPRAS